MLKNFFVLAVRNLLKRKVFSFINIVGLALGVSACLVILQYISFETSYDAFNKQASNIYRLNRNMIKNGERQTPMIMTTYGLGPTLAADIPEVRRSVRTHHVDGVLRWQPSSGEASTFHENDILAADSTFFHVFSFVGVAGNLDIALDNPNNIVLTETVARKYFGTEDPIGKTLTLSGGRMDATYTVAAIIEDVPENSHFTFNIVLPLHNIFFGRQYKEDDGWGWNNFVTYVQLNDGATQERATQKLPAFCQRYLDARWKEYGSRVELNLQPLRDIHLHPGIRHDGETVSRSTLYFFGVIAVFIILIAWINYINLSTARAMERAKEVGIKKVIGAFRVELMMQFLLESVVINLAGIVLAVGLAVVLLPMLGSIIGKTLTFDFTDIRLWVVLGGLLAVGTLASGVYPAFILSSFRITHSLNAKVREGNGFSLRKALVVFQFASSLVLIAGTFVVYRQINFMDQQDKGLQMDQMLIVNGPGTLEWKTAQRKLILFKDEARKIGGVESIATSGAIPGGGYNWGADMRRSGASLEESRSGSVVWIDPDFIPAYDISFVAGKNFDPSSRTSMKSVIINEATATMYGLGTPHEALNEQLLLDNDTFAITGVLKNYNWNSLKAEYTPFVFIGDTVSTAAISIHLAGGSIPDAVAAVGKLYKELMPGEPFEYHFLDESFNAQYKSDSQFGNIFGLFAGLAVSISCLGLWGLASFTTAQRVKEIGVRKVLGASTGSIVYLLSGQFLRLLVIASLIAMPLAWFGIDSWLGGFAFRIGIQWDLFVVPLFLLAIIALLTVSLQVLRGASVNPAKVLRSE